MVNSYLSFEFNFMLISFLVTYHNYKLLFHFIFVNSDKNWQWPRLIRCFTCAQTPVPDAYLDLIMLILGKRYYVKAEYKIKCFCGIATFDYFLGRKYSVCYYTNFPRLQLFLFPNHWFTIYWSWKYDFSFVFDNSMISFNIMRQFNEKTVPIIKNVA